MDKRLKIKSRNGFSFLRIVKLNNKELYLKYYDSLKLNNTMEMQNA